MDERSVALRRDAREDRNAKAAEEFAAFAANLELAARRKRAKRMFAVLAPSCADCGTTEADTYHPVPDDHLTFFAGDELCGRCARRHGVL